MNSDLASVIAFLRSIGLAVDVQEAAKGFIDGVRIEDGGLIVSQSCRPSGLLHEACHLACVPGRFRSYMGDNLAKGMGRMMTELREMALEPDHPLEWICARRAKPSMASQRTARARTLLVDVRNWSRATTGKSVARNAPGASMTRRLMMVSPVTSSRRKTRLGARCWPAASARIER